MPAPVLTDTRLALAAAADAQRAGRFDEAERRAGEVLRRDPANPAALRIAAEARWRREDPAGTLRHADALLAREPRDATGWTLRAHALLALDRHPEAAVAYDCALRLGAPDPAVPVNRAGLHLMQGEPAAALALLDRALAQAPGPAQVHANRAVALSQLQRHGEAAAAALQAAALDPGEPNHWMLAGNLQLAAGEPQRAVASFESALALDPASAALRLRHALACRRAGRTDDALNSLERAALLDPTAPAVLQEMVPLLCELGRADEALRRVDAAIARGGSHPDLMFDRCTALLRLGRASEAEAAAASGLAAGPADPSLDLSLRLNLGLAQRAALRLEAAIATLQAAVALQPGHELVRFALAQALLTAGRYDEGLPLYESRHVLSGRQEHPHRAPRWSGQPVAGRSVLLWGEQGLGDSIQFVRYALLLVERGARVVLDLPAPLRRLMRSLHPQVVVAEEGAPIAADYKCPLPSLPLACGTRHDTIPWPGPYLRADPDEAHAWAQRLGPRTGLRIGLKWDGNPRHVNDHHRSMPLAPLAALLAPGRELLSLAVEPRPADQALLAAAVPLRRFEGELPDLAATAALIAQLDLVISVDTAVAHLAAALGRPVWLLLPFSPDWRWGAEGATTPWYPGMRIFRQPRPGDWASVLEAVAGALAVQPPLQPAGA